MYMKKYAIILAGGIGSRMNSSIPKQFMQLDGESVLAHILRKFNEHPLIDGIILVLHADYIDEGLKIAEETGINKLMKIVAGGSSRKQSSFNGVAALPEEESYVLIHDAARPFVSDRIITDCCEILRTCKAASTVINSVDTVYLLDDNGVVEEVPDRKKVVMVQTPQCFHRSIIVQAHRKGAEDVELNFTDDSGMVKYYNLAEVHCVRGETANRKITTPEDLL